MQATPTSKRLRGLDLARALAICGMVIVNFELALQAEGTGPAWLVRCTSALQGRAAGTFVILAGLGASLLSARARRSGDDALRRQVKRGLQRRGLVLFLLGNAFLSVWPADILHFYGVYLFCGSWFLFCSTPRILAGVIISVLVGVAFLSYADWNRHWNFEALSYREFWTPAGYARNLFFDGWHPVFPWVALYLLGMILGRLPLREACWRRRVALMAAPSLIALEWSSARLAPSGIETTGLSALLATSSFPPTPGYVAAAALTAVLVIALCFELCAQLAPRRLAPWEALGRHALTHYVGHVIIGLGCLEAVGALEGRSASYALTASAIFIASALGFSWIWSSRFETGPLEWVFRRACRSGGLRRDPVPDARIRGRS